MSTGQLIIRKARAEDSAALQTLYRDLTGDEKVAVLPEEIDRAATDSRTLLIVAETGGKLYGTALAALCRDVMYGKQPFAAIENIIVDKSVRGTGVGEKLLKHIEAFCQLNDCTKIMLLSSMPRLEAHRFFASHGFSGDKKRGFVKYRREFSISREAAYDMTLRAVT